MSERHPPLPTLILITFFSLLLSACGAGDSSSAAEVASFSKGSFDGDGTSKPDDITDNGVSGGTDCNTLAALNNNEFCVSIEATSTMVAENTPSNSLFDLLTPQKAHAYLGLDTVAVKNIEAELNRILKESDLSKDLFEVVSKSLKV